MKELLSKILRVVMTPVRVSYRRRNGWQEQEVRREIPNRVLLGLARDMVRDGHTATIPVKGFSMRPFLEHQRDSVLLEAPAELKVGDAVLAEVEPDWYVLHRIVEIEGDDITLMGDGNIGCTEQCKRKDVAGVVTQYIRPRRTLSADDPKLVRRIRLWKRLYPIRRYLLFVYKGLV